MTILNSRLLAYLQDHLETYLADLTTLSGMDSYSSDREDVNHVVDWLEARLRADRFDVERFPETQTGDNLLAIRHGQGSGRIMLLGHSDTVFPHGTAAQRPLSFVGDKVLGPGTCDMKAGLLNGIYAVEALDSLGLDAYEELIFLVVSDEEIDIRPSVPLIRRASRMADAVFTLESARDNGDIVVARKGIRSFLAEAHGHAAHSGVEPEKGRNAIVAMARKLLELDKLNDLANGLSVNVGVISGGQLRNIVPDYARLGFEIRAFTPEALDRTTQVILERFQQESVPGVTFEVSYLETSPPMPRTPAIAALEGLAAQLAQELGFEVHGASTGGAADAAFAAAEGVPCLDGLGPIGGLDHSPDEYILYDSIVPRTALLARLIMEAHTVTK